MFIATMETEHFSFLAAGTSTEDAREAMARGWRLHHKAHGTRTVMNNFADLDTYYGVNITELKDGQCARDGYVLLPKRFKVEIGTASCKAGTWTGNELVFDTVDAAILYAQDLYGRWTATTRWRVIDFAGNLCALHDPENGNSYAYAKRKADV